jgi:Zn-dependent protease
MAFESDEFKDILLAISVATIIFSYNGSWTSFFNFLPAVFIIVSISFLTRSVAQKRIAARWGAKAFFKLWPFGSVIGLITMFVPPLKLALTGSTVVYSHKFARWKRRFERYSDYTELTIKEVGIISATGPGMNIILAMLGWVAFFVSGNIFFQYATFINSWLALLSLIPINPLDGAKVFVWKPWFWLVMSVVAVIFFGNSMPR